MVPARMTMVTLGVRAMAVMRAFYRGLCWPEGQHSNAWGGGRGQPAF